MPSLKLKNPGVANFGNAIINAGDMNGDGYDDIAVGAYDATITSGFVFIFGGGTRIDSTFDAAVGMSSESFFGYSISSVGDINGDGLADIIVGAPYYAFANEKGYWGIFLGDTAIHVTDVKEENLLPKRFKLYQSYPNPFNPITTIRYQLAESGYITLAIYNELGQEVEKLAGGYQEAGYYERIWDAKNNPSGSYFIRLLITDENGKALYLKTEKIVVMK
ncbi:MAG: FG-GAP repeat protein [Ignavibacteriales bacterium]|nr:FG-GAP repeat protein [Ignavibacteriales bacterium]